MSDMDDRLEEILARLDALERRLDKHESAGARCSFCEEEKRIVDTIVRRTTENIERLIDERMEGREDGPQHRRDERRDDRDHERDRRPPPDRDHRPGYGRDRDRR